MFNKIGIVVRGCALATTPLGTINGDNILKCFIASAFDKKDIDNIYDKVIIPVLKKYSIQPLRVDRIEHNDDIDDKIFHLINEADFCIADLTYSRPSVYYEAGYVFGNGKPVIYMARSDHFRPKLDDPDGILRIHFDLQMKNIISWSKANHVIRQKLEKRILRIIRPLIKMNLELNRTKTEEAEFSKFSQIRKQQLIIESVKNLLPLRIYSTPSHHVGITHPNKSFFCYSNNKSLLFFSEPTVTKKILENFRYYLSFNQDELRVNKTRELHIFYLSLKSIPKSRITEALPWFDIVDEHVYLTDWKNNASKVMLYIHIIDNIKSISEFNNKFVKSVNVYLKSA